MKVLAILLVCAVAVHGRSTAVEPKSSRSLAALGDCPWIVHLRIAVSTSGYLQTAVGSLITSNWVLTAAEAVQDVRFIWLRYGAVNVVNPSLVTESSANRLETDDYLGLVFTNRLIDSTEFFYPIALEFDADAPATAIFYAYGDDGADGPGELLQSMTLALDNRDDDITAMSDGGKPTRFDIGAPLVADGKQIGVLIATDSDGFDGVFKRISVDFIREKTGLNL